MTTSNDNHNISNHSIKNEHLRFSVSAKYGASPTSFELRRGDIWQPIMRPTPNKPSRAGQCSSFTLAPFSNRIRDARFVFAGLTHQLHPTATDGGTQHGDVRDRIWKIVQDKQSLDCFFDGQEISDLNYPWPFTMRVKYALDGLTLTTSLEFTNVADSAMPVGFGIHPYFVRSLFGSADCTVQFTAQGLYQTNASLIPTQAMQVIPSEKNFAAAQQPSNDINAVYGGLSSDVLLSWPGSGWRLKISADHIFSHLVVFAAPDGTIALEPVTNATDAFNLFAQGVADTGTIVLQPKATMRGEIRMVLENF